MEIKLKPGKYIVAVSGGVDSMVLLDLLKSQIPNPKSQIVVAHFDHGIHHRSAEYREFVSGEATSLGIEFAYEQGKLGPNTSEATAREARYKFLNKIKDEHNAEAILTAHHQDDVVETAIINLLRGTGRKGLSSLKSTKEIKRPMLAYGKKEVQDYAIRHDIEWREDPTNLDTSYLRNYVRLKIIPRLNSQQKRQLLDLIKNQRKTDEVFENFFSGFLKDTSQVDRKLFVSLGHKLAKELIAAMLRSRKIPFNAKSLEKSVVFAKTARQGKKFVISKNNYFEIQGNELKLICYN